MADYPDWPNLKSSTPGLVIPAKAVMHLSPDSQRVPAFAGATLIIIRSGGPQAHGYPSE
ncbi:hypothetical protein SBA2_280023 [Acidobacteriia bacterium SbA2]|nr:hypothetical protein SBA2_280023 [Acidobacteriia bacterium SbA2]